MDELYETSDKNEFSEILYEILDECIKFWMIMYA